MIHMSKRPVILQIALLCMGFFYSFSILAQSTQLDSLEKVYLNQAFTPENELLILKELSRESRDPQKKLTYSLKLKTRVLELGSLAYLYDAIMQEGSAYRLKRWAERHDGETR